MKNSMFMKIAMFLFAVSIVSLQPVFGVEIIQEETGLEPGALIEALTPLLVLGLTYLTRIVVPLIPSWGTVLVVTVLSTLMTFIAAKLEGGDLTWWQNVLWGLMAIVANQFYRAFTGGNSAAKARREAKIKK